MLDNKKARGTNYQRRRERRRNAIEKLRNFERFDLVFPSSYGTPQSCHNLRNRLFGPMLDDAGIARGKYSTEHLRHTFASHMAEIVSIKTLQELLGHASSATTVKYYIHTNAAAKAEASDRYAEMMYG